MRTTPAVISPVPPRVPAAARELISAAARGIDAAAAAGDDPRRQYALAHLAALRTAAAVLACRGRPASGRRRGPRSAWELLALVAPEFAEWAAFFAAGASKRSAAEAGIGVVTVREAADLVRDAETFLDVVCSRLGLPHQPAARPVLTRAG
jgi:hypothetical protein